MTVIPLVDPPPEAPAPAPNLSTITMTSPNTTAKTTSVADLPDPNKPIIGSIADDDPPSSLPNSAAGPTTPRLDDEAILAELGDCGRDNVRSIYPTNDEPRIQPRALDMLSFANDTLRLHETALAALPLFDKKDLIANNYSKTDLLSEVLSIFAMDPITLVANIRPGVSLHWMKRYIVQMYAFYNYLQENKKIAKDLDGMPMVVDLHGLTAETTTNAFRTYSSQHTAAVDNAITAFIQRAHKIGQQVQQTAALPPIVAMPHRQQSKPDTKLQRAIVPTPRTTVSNNQPQPFQQLVSPPPTTFAAPLEVPPAQNVIDTSKIPPKAPTKGRNIKVATAQQQPPPAVKIEERPPRSRMPVAVPQPPAPSHPAEPKTIPPTAASHLPPNLEEPTTTPPRTADRHPPQPGEPKTSSPLPPAAPTSPTKESKANAGLTHPPPLPAALTGEQLPSLPAALPAALTGEHPPSTPKSANVQQQTPHPGELKMTPSLALKIRPPPKPGEHPKDQAAAPDTSPQTQQTQSSHTKKKHCTIAHHRIREAIAAAAVPSVHNSSTENEANIPTKSLTKDSFFKPSTTNIFLQDPAPHLPQAKDHKDNPTEHLRKAIHTNVNYSCTFSNLNILHMCLDCQERCPLKGSVGTEWKSDRRGSETTDPTRPNRWTKNVRHRNSGSAHLGQMEEGSGTWPMMTETRLALRDGNPKSRLSQSVKQQQQQHDRR